MRLPGAELHVGGIPLIAGGRAGAWAHTHHHCGVYELQWAVIAVILGVDAAGVAHDSAAERVLAPQRRVAGQAVSAALRAAHL